ncbi:hypothetical protein C9J85_02685 [Haloferax sp. wsp5]|nr:hypothetical protein C9J85_02685 [Haloferax sp. wsp5]
MATNELLGLVAGAVLLGAVHGVEPGHGWPVAACDPDQRHGTVGDQVPRVTPSDHTPLSGLAGSPGEAVSTDEWVRLACVTYPVSTRCQRSVSPTGSESLRGRQSKKPIIATR